jgi:hypothetical protein
VDVTIEQAGYGVGGFGDDGFQVSATIWGGLAGFGIFGAIMYWVFEYILYLIKAEHIAVLIELIDGKAMAEGRSQIAYATSVVKERFPQVGVLFGIDQLIKGVICTIAGLVRGILPILPVPGAQHGVALNGTSSGCFETAELAREHRAQTIERYRDSFDNVVVKEVTFDHDRAIGGLRLR